jgi:hypothetical protein
MQHLTRKEGGQFASFIFEAPRDAVNAFVQAISTGAQSFEIRKNILPLEEIVITDSSRGPNYRTVTVVYRASANVVFPLSDVIDECKGVLPPEKALLKYFGNDPSFKRSIVDALCNRHYEIQNGIELLPGVHFDPRNILLFVTPRGVDIRFVPEFAFFSMYTDSLISGVSGYYDGFDAPESFDESRGTAQENAFVLAMVLYELVTGQRLLDAQQKTRLQMARFVQNGGITDLITQIHPLLAQYVAVDPNERSTDSRGLTQWVQQNLGAAPR